MLGCLEIKKMDDINKAITDTENSIKKKKKIPHNIETDLPPIAEEKKVESPRIEKPAKEEKPKRPRKTKKDDALNDQLKTMIAALSEIVGSIPGCAIWRLHETEIEMVTPPAVSILKRQGLDKKASKYGDYIMLAGAVTFIVAPRLIILSKQKGGKNANKNTGDTSGRKTDNPGPQAAANSGNNNSTNTPGGHVVNFPGFDPLG